MDALTDRQREVLAFIVTKLGDDGRQPTFREICARFGFASTNAVYDLVTAFEKKGYVKRTGFLSRGLMLTERARREILGPPCASCGGTGRRA